MGWGKEKKKTTEDGIFKSSQLVGFLLQRAMNQSLDLVFWFYFGFCLFGVLCLFVFWMVFWVVLRLGFFFFNGAYLQTPEKKIRRHPNHRGAVEILLYLTFLR